MKRIEDIEQMLEDYEESTRKYMDLQAQTKLAEMRKNDIKASIIRCYMPDEEKPKVDTIISPIVESDIQEDAHNAVEAIKEQDVKVQESNKKGRKSKQHIILRKLETGEEKEFNSQTAAALFLDMSQPQLSVMLKVRTVIKGWKVEFKEIED